jgi:hypothetical protein
MKYRIKSFTNENGHTICLAQYKDFLFWYTFEDSQGFGKEFDSLDECKKYLEKNIKFNEFLERSRKIVKIEIIDIN